MERLTSKLRLFLTKQPIGESPKHSTCLLWLVGKNCQELYSISCPDTLTHLAKAQLCSRWTFTLLKNGNTNCVQHQPGQSQMSWMPRHFSVTMPLKLVMSGVQQCQGWLHQGDIFCQIPYTRCMEDYSSKYPFLWKGILRERSNLAEELPHFYECLPQLYYLQKG